LKKKGKEDALLEERIGLAKFRPATKYRVLSGYATDLTA
jgi:hypothetical protein